MTQSTAKTYSPSEERLNIISHALGLLLSLIGTYFLITKAIKLASPNHFWSYSSYALSLLLLYLASTSYHSAKGSKRQYLKVFDHAAIYLLIAGTYIPYSIIGIGGIWGKWIVIIISILALAGVLFKVFFTGRFPLMSTISYVLMGCLVLVAIKPLHENLSPEAIHSILIGGAFYVIGAVLYLLKRIPYNHAIFHLFVLLGSTTHYLGILRYI